MAKKVAAKKPQKKASAKSAANAKNKKYTYLFGVKTDGDAKMRNLLGGKGANLAEMARIGLPVPPGFTITTEVCTYFYENGKKYPSCLDAQVKAGVQSVEKQMGKIFGDEKDPLLFSVRSGARESMPGMMDTILNLGLNDKTVEGLAAKTQNPRFAWDCYRRFIQMYGDVVMGVQARNEADVEPFHHVMEGLKSEVGARLDTDLTVDALKELVKRYKALIKQRAGKSFPQDVYEQLWGAIGAVFGSWMNERAILYRQKYNIPASWGTAVNVQTMVFGNKGETSATGVAFTRDPANGENQFYGEYLINAQGEDVVAGVRTPHKIAELSKEMPKAFKELLAIRKKLENHFKDMQDFEFTIEENKLYMLQTRNGKRTGMAAVRIAVEMNKERFMDEKTAVQKIPADSTVSDVNIFAIKGAIDALGQVKSASVERVFPDVLRIKTSEYKPIAKAKIEINSSIKEYLLAETGEFFEPSCMPVEVFNSLPTVQGLNIVLENGKPLPYRHAKTVTNFLRYANARMPEQASKWNTLRLGALDSRILPLIEVVTQDGVKIIFLPENLKKQFDRLDYILRYSVQKPLLNIEKIDLSLDNRSDVKLKRQ